MSRNLTQYVCLVAVAMIAASVASRAALAQPVGGEQDAKAQTTAAMLDDANVTSAIMAAWKSCSNGKIQIEAGFRLDGTPSKYRIVAFRGTNEVKRKTIPIVPGDTFVVFHVHPTTEAPVPSAADKNVAAQYHFRIITLHLRGVYEYDPSTGKTMLIADLPALLKSAGRTAGSSKRAMSK